MRRARRETDLLDPINSVRYVDAVVLSGGSAFGLAAADGVMTWLEEHDRGVAMEGGVVPIVPAAVIFDLPVGGWQNRPTAEFGYAAAESGSEDVGIGTVGAGTGRTCRRAQGRRRDRIGDARDPVSPSGRWSSSTPQVMPSTRRPDCPGWRIRSNSSAWLPRRPTRSPPMRDRHTELSPLNTTIAVVATDAALSKAGCRRVAVAAHDGLARTIRPCHTPLDGDTVFALATGAVEVPPDPTTPGSMSPETRLITDIGAAAADCLARAVLVGVLAAESVAGIPSYRDMLPGAFE